MPTRTPSETVAKLQTLPTATLLALLTALSDGDLEAAAQAGGGGTRKQLADLQPNGESGQLLDDLERRVLFLLSRKVGLALMRALPAAITTLAAIAEGVAPGEADPLRDENEKLRIVQTNMRPKGDEQRRLAALALFDLAEKLALFDLSKAYREPDREADEEAELQRMAAAQGIDYLPPLVPLETPLRRVK